MNKLADELNYTIFTEDFFPTLVGKKVKQRKMVYEIKPLNERVKRGLFVPAFIELGDGEDGKASVVAHGGHNVIKIPLEEVYEAGDGLPTLQELLSEFPKWKRAQIE